jgi:hypothetical protein
MAKARVPVVIVHPMVETLQSQSPVKSQKPWPRHWTNFAIGRSWMALAATASITKKEIAVELCLGGPPAKTFYHKLLSDREAIEKDLGTKPDWRERPGKNQSIIKLLRLNVDPGRRKEWSEQHAWFQDNVEAFQRVFGPKVKHLSAERYTPEAAPP